MKGKFSGLLYPCTCVFDMGVPLLPGSYLFSNVSYYGPSLLTTLADFTYQYYFISFSLDICATFLYCTSSNLAVLITFLLTCVLLVLENFYIYVSYFYISLFITQCSV